MNEKKQVNLSLTFERESEDGKETDSFSCVGEIEKVGTKTHIHYSRKDGEMNEDVVGTVRQDSGGGIARTGGGYKRRRFISNGEAVPADYLTP